MNIEQTDGSATGMVRIMADSENKGPQNKRRRRGSRHRRRKPAAETKTAPQSGEKHGVPGERPRRGPRRDPSRQPAPPGREREQGRGQGREQEKRKPVEEKKPAAEKKKRFPGSSPLDPVYAPMSRRRKSDDLEGTPLKSGTIISEDLFPSRDDPDDSSDTE